MSAARKATAPRRTEAQNRAIWSAVSDLTRLGLSKDDAQATMRDICRAVSGQEHSSLLSETQAAEVITRLHARLTSTPAPPVQRQAQRQPSAPHDPWGPRQPVDRAEARVTPRMIEVLGFLFQDADMGSLPQQVAFTRRQLKGRSRPETLADADALFEPLKAIILRRTTLPEIQARLAAVAGRPELDDFLRGFVPDVIGRVEKQGLKAITPGRLAKLVEAEVVCGLRG